jgi:hypothetical protein
LVDQLLQKICIVRTIRDAETFRLRSWRRQETKAEFAAVRGEMKVEFGGMRSEMNERLEGLENRLAAMHRLMIQFCGLALTALVGLIATQI